jgi:hypothetical protein
VTTPKSQRPTPKPSKFARLCTGWELEAELGGICLPRLRASGAGSGRPMPLERGARRGAGSRAERFHAASSPRVIRVLHPTTGASVRLASVGQPHPYSPRPRAWREYERGPASRLAEAGNRAATPGPRRSDAVDTYVGSCYSALQEPGTRRRWTRVRSMAGRQVAGACGQARMRQAVRQQPHYVHATGGIPALPCTATIP